MRCSLSVMLVAFVLGLVSAEPCANKDTTAHMCCDDYTMDKAKIEKVVGVGAVYPVGSFGTGCSVRSGSDCATGKPADCLFYALTPVVNIAGGCNVAASADTAPPPA